MDWNSPYLFKQQVSQSQSQSQRNLYCDGCGSQDFEGDDDGFFYCTQCGSQSRDLINTAIDEDAFIEPGIYHFHHTRSRPKSQPAQIPNYFSQEFHQTPGLHAPARSNAAVKEEGCVKFAGFDDDDEGPRDFGSVGVCMDEEKVADSIRLRYVEGLQVMLQSQCEVLVEEFGVSAYVAGIVGQIWLRYVSTTRVLADDWPKRVIEESEVVARANGLVRLGERKEKSKRRKHICSAYKSQPHNAYGQRAIFIWLRALRKALPLYSTLAISFLVCHIAREPILPTDFFKWTSEGKLPYVTAFVGMDGRLGNRSNACPLSSMALFRPNLVIGPQQLEATAASIAQTIGLRLPSVNFYAIAHRYLKELYLPVHKILPHACKIYEWSLPANLWLSSNISGFSTRACVMSMLIIAMRLLYNIQGQGTWEMSRSEIKKHPSNHQKDCLNSDSSNSSFMPKCEYLNVDPKNNCSATGLEPTKKLLQIQTSDYNREELLNILEATYDKINTAHDYLKDVFSYLKHCKDVVYIAIPKPYEEERLIERLWDMYEKQEDDCAEEAKKPRNGISINDSLDPKETVEDSGVAMTPMEEDIAAEDHPREPLMALNLPNHPTAAQVVAIDKIKLEMEENGFEYLPPRAHQNIGYVHYRRQRIDGKLVYVSHADYYILLRACAKLVQVDVQTMHRCVLSLERRLDWIDRQIDKLYCHQDGGV